MAASLLAAIAVTVSNEASTGNQPAAFHRFPFEPAGLQLMPFALLEALYVTHYCTDLLVTELTLERRHFAFAVGYQCGHVGC